MLLDLYSEFYLVVTCTLILTVQTARLHREPVCHTSGDCHKGSCCRDYKGYLITLSGTFDTVGPIQENRNGTCVELPAQYGEHCGEFCPCDHRQGLRCYRQVSDHDFAPSICREKTFVEKQIRFWLECFKDPKCQLPV